ncbi:hypothetical protein AAF712_016412 [Marasmius tenuissimus]|uniref:SAP domain-containing protein n=1 Tax=Marasmius tenuissimus TaxID=585030 RepID=A0ABR2Z5S0_9AGAR
MPTFQLLSPARLLSLLTLTFSLDLSDDEAVHADSDDEDTTQSLISAPPTSAVTPASVPIIPNLIPTPTVSANPSSSSILSPASQTGTGLPNGPFRSTIPKTPIPSARYKNAYTRALEAENAVLREENTRMGAHCSMAHDKIKTLKQQAQENEKRGKKKRKLNVDSRCLTSSQALAQYEKENQEREAGEARKEASRDAREDQQRQRQEDRAHRDPNKPFTGSLGSKNKPDLQDIAWVLGLSIDGQKKDLIAHITAHFDTHPDLKTDLRFCSLFSRTARTADESLNPGNCYNSGINLHASTSMASNYAGRASTKPQMIVGSEFRIPFAR